MSTAKKIETKEDLREAVELLHEDIKLRRLIKPGSRLRPALKEEIRETVDRLRQFKADNEGHEIRALFEFIRKTSTSQK